MIQSMCLSNGEMSLTDNDSSLLLVENFLKATKEDLDSPVTSNFGQKISDYRERSAALSIDLDAESPSLNRLRKCARDLQETSELYRKQQQELAGALQDMAVFRAAKAMDNSESELGAAFLKFSMLLKELSVLSGLLSRCLKNGLVHPLDILTKDHFKTKTDLKRNVDKATRDYETKFAKIEKDLKLQAKVTGYTRNSISHAEISEQLSRERTIVQYELCKFFLAVDTIDDKKGPDLLRLLTDFFRSYETYFEDGLKSTQLFRGNVDNLMSRFVFWKSRHEQSRSKLFALKELLENTPPVRIELKRDFNNGQSWSGLNRDNSIYGSTEDTLLETGEDGQKPLGAYLWKKSDNKFSKQWQKRLCRLSDGKFHLYHSDKSEMPVQMNLIVCDVKLSATDSKCFDLYCRDRTYHFQAETEVEARRWMCLVRKEIELAKKQLWQTEGTANQHNMSSSETVSHWSDLNLCLAALRLLPGNDMCADCSQRKDISWVSTNLGSLLCISCSGVHRDLGVHISRIQSLDLDVLRPAEFLIPLSISNATLNAVLEAGEQAALLKPSKSATRCERKHFIEQKYKERKFARHVDEQDVWLSEAIESLNPAKLYAATICGANLNPPTDVQADNRWPLFRVTEINHPMTLPLVEILLQNGGAGNDRGRLIGVLRVCVERDHADQLRLLLRSKMVTVGDMQTVLDLAVQNSRHQCAKIIKAAMAGDRYELESVKIPRELLSVVIRDCSVERNELSHTEICSSRLTDIPEPCKAASSNNPTAISAKPYSRSSSECAHKIISLCKHGDEDGRQLQQRSETTLCLPPLPAPRKGKGRRLCRALYDCPADNADELTFSKGDLILVTRERVQGEDPSWMEGCLQTTPDCCGMFPVTFVTFEI